ncbi:hypothetical protein PVAP13_5NG284934, partial [Panicum virgatum]
SRQPRHLLSLSPPAAPPPFSLPAPSSRRRPSPPLTPLCGTGRHGSSGPARGAAGSACARETEANTVAHATSAQRTRGGSSTNMGPARARPHGRQEEMPRRGHAAAARRRPGGGHGAGVQEEDQRHGRHGACVGSNINKQ